jgi:hypothetical protein
MGPSLPLGLSTLGLLCGSGGGSPAFLRSAVRAHCGSVTGLPSFGQATIGLSAKGIESGIRGKGRDASGEGADLAKGLCLAGRGGGPSRPNVALEASLGRRSCERGKAVETR